MHSLIIILETSTPVYATLRSRNKAKPALQKALSRHNPLTNGNHYPKF